MRIETLLPVDQLASEVLSGVDLQKELSFDFAGCKIDLKTNSQELIEDLEKYYKNFVIHTKEKRPADIQVLAIQGEPPEIALDLEVKQPDPGKDKIKEEYLNLPDGRIVRKRLTGMVFLFGRDTHLAVGPCVENSNQVINFINNRHIQWKLNRGAILGHAAAVLKDDRAVAIAGFSGAGKSTLALHMMSFGVQYVSNDRVMISEKAGVGGNASPEKVEVTGVAKLPRINPGTILNNQDLQKILSSEEKEEFLSLPSEELWKLEHKYDVFIDDIYGPGKFVLSAPMCGLILLNWKRDNGPLRVSRIHLRERPELLPAFKKDTGLFFFAEEDRAAPDFSDEHYFSMLEKVDVVEISGSVDFDCAAELGMHLLRNDQDRFDEQARKINEGMKT